jgi:hypothetical protein
MHSGGRPDRAGLRWSGCYLLAARSGVVGRRPRVRAAVIHARDFARLACAPQCSIPSASWFLGLPSLYWGRAEERGREPPSVIRVGTKPPRRRDNADRSPTPAPQSKPVTLASRLVTRDRAVGGIRTRAENSGRRASYLPTVLLSRALCEPLPKFVAMDQREPDRGGSRSVRSVGYMPREGVWSR